MNQFVSKILSDNLIEAKNELEKKLSELVVEKLKQAKLRLTAEMYDENDDFVTEANIMKMGRAKVIKVRIRKGKVQRRKKLSAVKGYTFRGGKLTRMSPLELRNRRLAARRSKFKRRAKLKQALRKRNISLRRRAALGL